MQPSPDASQKKPKSIWFYIWNGLLLILLLAFAVSFLDFNFGTFWERPGRYRPSQAEAEINAMTVALEAYKTDHGNYPSDPNSTEQLRANVSSDPADYIASSAFLYRALAGNPKASNPLDQTVYFEFPSSRLKTDAQGRTYIVDPWGNSYGYSTFKALHPQSRDGNNSTFDLWSTGGTRPVNGVNSPQGQIPWIRNWQVLY